MKSRSDDEDPSHTCSKHYADRVGSLIHVVQIERLTERISDLVQQWQHENIGIQKNTADFQRPIRLFFQ